MLFQLKEQGIGWAKNIEQKLTEYGLEPRWDAIQQKSKGEWKRDIELAVDKENKEKLIRNCTSKTIEGIKINRKTKTTHEDLQSPTYNRRPIIEITKGNKLRTKTLILARHGMLECGKNYKGTMSEMCKYCNELDDENHRINNCLQWETINLANNNDKIDFHDIYSNGPY